MTGAAGWQGRASQGQVSPGESLFSAGAIAPVLGKEAPSDTRPDGAEKLQGGFHLHPLGHCLQDYSIYCIHFTSLLAPSPLCLEGLLAKAQRSPTPTQPWLVGLWDGEGSPELTYLPPGETNPFCPFPKEPETQGIALVSRHPTPFYLLRYKIQRNPLPWGVLAGLRVALAPARVSAKTRGTGQCQPTGRTNPLLCFVFYTII